MNDAKLAPFNPNRFDAAAFSSLSRRHLRRRLRRCRRRRRGDSPVNSRLSILTRRGFPDELPSSRHGSTL